MDWTLPPRGAAAERPPELLERESELHLVSEAVRNAPVHGALFVFEGPAGIGRSLLLAELARIVEGLGARTLRGRGGELEVDFSFGVARQLFEPGLADADPAEREALVAAAGAAGDVLTSARLPATDHEPARDATLSGIWRLVRRLAERQPVLLTVDDLQWVDRSSLELLVYLAQRLENVPLVMIVTRTTGERGPNDDLADRLEAAPLASTERLAPLSTDGVRAIIGREGFAAASDSFIEAALEATGGLPFLVEALLDSARSRGLDAGTHPEHLAELASAAVSRSTARRLDRLPDSARALATATAVLGRDANESRAGRVAGLDHFTGLEAADALRRAGMLRGPHRELGFRHSLVRVSLYKALSPRDRAAAHVEVARVLASDGADPVRTAEHLLQAQRLGEPWAIGALRAAGRSALATGQVGPGIAYLRRALDEDPETGERAELLAELGEAEAASGDPDGAAKLALAAESTPSAPARARTLERLGGALWLLGQDSAAAEAFERGLRVAGSGTDQAGEARMRAGLLMAARFDPELREPTMRRLEPVFREPGFGRAREPALLASIAFERALIGRRSTRVADLAERALEHLLTDLDTLPGPDCYAACCALLWADSLATAEIALTMATEAARARGHAVAAATALRLRAWTVLQRGRLAHAAADTLQASGSEGPGPTTPTPSAAAILAEIDMEQGRLDEAALLLDDPAHRTTWDDGPRHAFHLAARGRLSHLRGEHEAALEDLLESGRRLESLGVHNPSVLPWRSRAAIAAVSAGDRARGIALASQECSLARTFGAGRSLGVALRAAALTGPPEQRLHLLRESVACLEHSPAALDRARALIDLGTELRRRGQRRRSRDCLRAGLDLAQRCEASLLEARGREELTAAGARPRRGRLSGSEALTPRERQVAELAARGVPNREIGQRLFITPKTVEWHLGNAYRKLELHSRGSLTGALSGRDELEKSA